MKTSRMLIESTFERITENPSLKYDLISLISNSTTTMNESVISTKDPDFFKLSSHIDINKNYLELIQRSLISAQMRHLIQIGFNSYDFIIDNKKARYSLTTIALDCLL